MGKSSRVFFLFILLLFVSTALTSGSTLKCKKGEVKTQMLYIRCGLSCKQICASNKQCRTTSCEKVSLSPDEPATDQCVICQTTKKQGFNSIIV
ncbi:hypothetical protein MKX01_014414 [Papaver californicum]|nr:hypothetical protein MKX01_014414 [Papaver californicum]